MIKRLVKVNMESSQRSKPGLNSWERLVLFANMRVCIIVFLSKPYLQLTDVPVCSDRRSIGTDAKTTTIAPKFLREKQPCFVTEVCMYFLKISAKLHKLGSGAYIFIFTVKVSVYCS